MRASLCLLAMLFSSAAFAADGATVILIKGLARTEDGRTLALKDVVRAGTTIKTEAKSFVKLMFKDQTQVSIGPDTRMKIEETRQGDPSLLNLVGGQIRAKVTKDVLKDQSTETKEKMLIKTKTAAMGIRGTDFQVTYNVQNQNTALVTFEGTVAMVRSEPNRDPLVALARGGSAVQQVTAGQFSAAQPDRAQVTVPVKISPAQLETLKANETFQGAGEKPQNKEAGMASPIPPGVDPKIFASNGEGFLNSAAGRETAPVEPADVKGPPPEGFFDATSGVYAPRAGGFIDVTTGIYVPPPPGSTFDANTGVYVPPSAMGTVDPSTGMYVPPKGLDLDPVKGFVPEKTPTPSPGAGAGATSPGGSPGAGAPGAGAPGAVSPGAGAPGSAVGGTKADAAKEGFAKLMNSTMDSKFAGQTVTHSPMMAAENFGSPGGGIKTEALVAMGFAPPPPGTNPPPGSLPPPNGLPPPPQFIGGDPNNACDAQCQEQNRPPIGPSTTVNFNITVGP